MMYTIKYIEHHQKRYIWQTPLHRLPTEDQTGMAVAQCWWHHNWNGVRDSKKQFYSFSGMFLTCSYPGVPLEGTGESRNLICLCVAQIHEVLPSPHPRDKRMGVPLGGGAGSPAHLQVLARSIKFVCWPPSAREIQNIKGIDKNPGSVPTFSSNLTTSSSSPLEIRYEPTMYYSANLPVSRYW